MAIPVTPDMAQQVSNGLDAVGWHLGQWANVLYVAGLAALPYVKRGLDDLHGIATSLEKLTSKISGEDAPHG